MTIQNPQLYLTLSVIMFVSIRPSEGHVFWPLHTLSAVEFPDTWRAVNFKTFFIIGAGITLIIHIITAVE